MGFLGALGAIGSAVGGAAKSLGSTVKTAAKKDFTDIKDNLEGNKQGQGQKQDQGPAQPVISAETTPMMNQMPMYDKGGTLPKINLHDGNHKLVVAEAGERILTPEQNHEYEAQHPDARKEPMVAEVYDGSGVVGGSEISEATPLGKSIANRTQELYAQAKDGGQNIMDPKDPGSAGRRRETNAVLNAVSSKNEGDPSAPYVPSANDRVHPLGQAYGARPGEKRIYTDPEGNAVNPTTPQGLGAVGPKAPIPTALGKLPTYDDGGTVQTEEAPGQAQLDDEKLKVAAHQQAIAEHEQALGEVPLGHGQPQAREAAQDTAMHRYPAPQKPARLQYDTEKPVDESKGVAELGGDARMNTDNAPLAPPVMNRQNAAPWETNPVQEISAKTGKATLGQAAPPSGELKQLPGGPISDDVKQAVGQSDMGPDVSKTPPTPQEIINMDRMDAMKSGDLVKLGMAHINERALQSGGVLPMPTPTAPTAQENLINQRKELKDKMINGATEQIRFQAEKDLAELNRRSPLGSEGNHPGFVGKLGHVLGRVGQAALAGTAPYLLPAIPGSQAQLAQQEARGEQGVEQAQAKEMQTAKIAEEKKLPEVAKQRADIAQQAADVKQQEADTKQERVESQEVLDTAKANAQNSIAELKRAQADPNSPQSQAILAKAKNDARRVDLAAGKLGLDADRYKADYLGVDHDGNPLAGAQVTPEGKPVGPKMVPKGDEAGKVFDKYSGTIDKTAAPFVAAYQRSGLLAKNLDLKSKQADALVAPELLSIAAGGAGSGLRMNEAEISRVIGGRSVFDALVARANQIKESGGTFDEAQRAQLKEIAGYINARNGAEVMLFNMGREALLANKGDAGKVREIYEHMQEVSSDLAGKGLIAPGQKAEIGEYVVHNGQVLKITSVKDGKTLGEVVKF